MPRPKKKNVSRLISNDVMAIILNMATRFGSRSALGVYVGGSRGLLSMWEKGHSFPSPAAQAALISLSNGELEPEDFMGMPIRPRMNERMFDFIKLAVIEPRAKTLGITVDEYLTTYVAKTIRQIVKKRHITKEDIPTLTVALYNDKSFWLKVYRRFIPKGKIYDKHKRQIIESQELADDVPNRNYHAEL